MTGGVRVLLFHTAPELAEIDPAYHEVSRRLAGTPGLRGNELLRSVQDPTEFVVVSSWADLSAFQRWEGGSDHRANTAPLRPFRHTGSGRAFGVYEVTAAY